MRINMQAMMNMMHMCAMRLYNRHIVSFACDSA